MKKSLSAISGLSATLNTGSGRKIVWLDLSDSDDEYPTPSAPKKARSDITPISDYLDGPIHCLSMPNGLQPSQPSAQNASEIVPLFAETPTASSDPLIPDELVNDVENRASEVKTYEKPDIEDFCSSSSEFEIDDDSDDEFELPPSLLQPHSAALSPATTSPIVISLDDSITELSEPETPASTLPPTRSPFTSVPRAQASITSYFGLNNRNLGISTVSKTAELDNSATTKKRPAPTPKHPSVPDILRKAGQSPDAKDKNREFWSRQPTVRDACPFYKRIAGTTFIVDAFQCIYKTPATKSFFLSHFHSDHYGGLNSRFDRGLIYCSPITAALVTSSLRVHPQYVKSIPLNTPVFIEGVEVTLFDANHCPGAAILLFRLPDNTLHLHTGDFRFDGDLPDHIKLLVLQGKISNLYLDTTYANPTYSFPPQQLVISSVLDLVAPYARDPNTLFLVGTYTIGKERMFLALAERYGLKFYAKPSKMKILKCLEIDTILQEYCTTDQLEARIHIVPIFDLSLKKLEALLDSLPLVESQTASGIKTAPRPKWNRIIAIRPTGWAYASPKKSNAKKSASSSASMASYVHMASPEKPASVPVTQGISTSTSRRGAITIHSCPYSEHSSFLELCTFVRTLKPRWIIPTVNNRSREDVLKMVSNLRG